MNHKLLSDDIWYHTTKCLILTSWVPNNNYIKNVSAFYHMDNYNNKKLIISHIQYLIDLTDSCLPESVKIANLVTHIRMMRETTYIRQFSFFFCKSTLN